MPRRRRSSSSKSSSRSSPSSSRCRRRSSGSSRGSSSSGSSRSSSSRAPRRKKGNAARVASQKRGKESRREKPVPKKAKGEPRQSKKQGSARGLDATDKTRAGKDAQKQIERVFDDSKIAASLDKELPRAKEALPASSAPERKPAVDGGAVELNGTMGKPQEEIAECANGHPPESAKMDAVEFRKRKRQGASAHAECEEDLEIKLQRGIESLQDILNERKKKKLEAKDDAELLDIEADIDILKSLVREKELELLKETARKQEQTTLAELDQRKKLEAEREQQKQKEKENMEEDKRLSHEAQAVEDLDVKLQREVGSLQEMLNERRKQQMEAKDCAETLDIEADMVILKDLVRQKELELFKETARKREEAMLADREHLKRVLTEKEQQKQKEEEEKKRNRQREQEELDKENEREKERQLAAERERKEAEAREPHILPPEESEPPCELPKWCVMPRRQDIVVDVELVRLKAGSSELLKRVWFGRRAWALFGRRQPGVQTADPKPDIGLAAARASRKHALLMRNWLGQVFLIDLGSPNGTYLDKHKLSPHTLVEWRVGNVVYFGDPTPEVYELRVWKAPENRL